MPDNDTPDSGRNGGSAGYSPARGLITLERSQKLDLLIHLIANLRQALIVCGPEGIGKTTLLNELLSRFHGQWRICLLRGSANLSFESVIIALYDFLQLGSARHGFDLAMLRGYCETQTVLLVIDDAGGLTPGLLGELLDLSAAMSGLRLVFSMTYDEFHIKGATDKTVEDCHMIEIPPLSKRQCGEFLQNLSAQPGAMLPFKAVNEELATAVYLATHGIPGRILAELPKIIQYRRKRERSRFGVWLGAIAIMLVAGWIFLSSSILPKPNTMTVKRKPETPSNEIVPATAVEPKEFGKLSGNAIVGNAHLPEAQKEQAEISLLTRDDLKSADISESIESLPEKTIEINPATAIGDNAGGARDSDGAEVKPKLGTVNPLVETLDGGASQKAPAATQDVGASDIPPGAVQNKKPEAAVARTENNQAWIMAQPPANFTLQVMVLSSKDSANRFIKKHSQLSENLGYYSIGGGGQEKFVLIYGSFKTEREARESKALLPNEFSQALEKRFGNVQRENRR